MAARLKRGSILLFLGLVVGAIWGGGLIGSGLTRSASAVSPQGQAAAGPTPAYPLYAWGDSWLGNGTTSNSTIPVLVNLPAGVTPLQLAGGQSHNLTIGSDNQLYSWGNNQFGQLGNGSTNANPTPAVLSLAAGVTPAQIAAGNYHNLAIGSDNKLYSWGFNQYGQVGNGSTALFISTPVTVSLAAGVAPVLIATGYYHSLAVGSDGKLYAWGSNSGGQLGNNSTTDSNTPVRINLPAGATPTQIAAGSSQSLAVGSNGKLYAWGYNTQGQLGNGSTASSSIPVTVSLPAGVTATSIAMGGNHSLAIGSDNQLYAWGNNQFGQLGNGSTASSSIPVTVSLPAGVRPIAIAAGSGHSLAIGNDGKLYAWGANNYGQLGNGALTGLNPNPLPIAVGSVAGVAQPLLAAGVFHTLAPLAVPGQISVTSGNNQSVAVGTPFGAPLVATVRDVINNPISNTTVIFTAPGSGASGTFAGGSNVYTGTTDASGTVTTSVFTANTITGSYSVTATVSGVITPATFSLTNLLPCNPLNVTSNQDDGSCGTLRYAVASLAAPLTSKPKTITINLAAGSVISLTSGLTLTSGVAITTTAPCGVGAGNTMLPPVIIQGVGSNSGVGLTLRGHNQLYGLWVRGFSGVQIKAPVGSTTKMQCVRASKS